MITGGIFTKLSVHDRESNFNNWIYFWVFWIFDFFQYLLTRNLQIQKSSVIMSHSLASAQPAGFSGKGRLRSTCYFPYYKVACLDNKVIYVASL